MLRRQPEAVAVLGRLARAVIEHRFPSKPRRTQGKVCFRPRRRREVARCDLAAQPRRRADAKYAGCRVALVTQAVAPRVRNLRGLT
jgi:hypothetical protein